nr:nucleoside-diphosphate kinase [uncultured Actinoplanes sp.]
MPDLALVVVKPDGVHQRLTPAVLEFLAARGFEPLSAVTLHLTPDLRGRLYATTRTGGRLDWELNAVLYTLGPVTAVLLRGSATGHGHQDAATHLSAGLKGHFLPTRARPGTLRGDLPSLNPIFNLVHASDDERELAREVTVLFGRTAAEVLTTPDLTAVRTAGPARPLDHWRVAGSVIARLLRPTDVDKAWRLLSDVGWPGAAASRREAFAAVRRAREDLLPELATSPAAVTAGLPALLAGREDKLPGFARFHAAATAVPAPPSQWDTYLTYTSLHYLDLSLEIPHEQ